MQRSNRSLALPSLDLSSLDPSITTCNFADVQAVLTRLEHANGICNRAEKRRSQWWKSAVYLCAGSGLLPETPCACCEMFGGDVTVPIEEVEERDFDVFAMRREAKKDLPRVAVLITVWTTYIRYLTVLLTRDAKRHPLFYVCLAVMVALEVWYLNKLVFGGSSTAGMDENRGGAFYESAVYEVN